MRARQRHFNARDAGAGTVFDARFISDISDNSTLDTWRDRSRNAWNATQTGALRPTYIARELNGQPVVSCASQFMTFSAGAEYYKNKSAGFMLVVCRSNNLGDSNLLLLHGLREAMAQVFVFVFSVSSVLPTHFKRRSADWMVMGPVL